MKTAFTILLTLCISLCTAYGADTTGRIDLSGPWRFQLDPTGFGKAPGSEIYLARLPGTIMLPGSTDQAGQGIMNTARRIDRLSRRFEYCGHPSLKGFPTSYYADWQWYDILNAGTAIDVTALRGLVPVIQPVDTYEVNRKLALAFEVRSGEGRLFVLSVDMDTDMDSRPASGGLLRSVMEYVASGAFSPQVEVPLEVLDAIFSAGAEPAAGNGAAQEQLLTYTGQQ